MLLIGCTGGIGSGKSTVAGLLAARGAVVLDADRIARAVVEPGEPAYDEVVACFGPGVVGPDGCLDRQALAAVVFEDAERRRALEAIIHPAVRASIEAFVEAHRGGPDVVVLDLPLLVESSDPWAFDGVLVVDAPEEVALERLVRERAMTEQDARARMAAQASRAERLARADFVIVNSGSLEELEELVEGAWTWIGAIAPRTA